MEFPQQVVTEITVPNNVPFAPGYDVIGIGTQLPPAVIAAGYPAAILFYSSSYDPLLSVPQIKYQFIADKGGTIYFGYGLVANASVSQAETIVTYEAHGFAATDAQSDFTYITARTAGIDNATVGALAANTSFLYKGTELQVLLDAITASVNAQSTLGVISYGNLGQASGPWVVGNNVRAGMFYIGANLTANRLYRLRMTPMSIQCAAANVNIGFFITFTTNGTVPGLITGGATNTLIGKTQSVQGFVDNFDWTVEFLGGVATQWNFLFGLDNTVTNHGAGNATATAPGSVTVTVEDIGAGSIASRNNLSNAFTPPPPTPTTYTVDQNATTTRAFRGNGSQINTNAEMYMGQSPAGANGVTHSDAFFTGSGPNTLGYLFATGATPASLVYMRLQIVIRHWYYSAGGRIRFGYGDTGGYHFVNEIAFGPAPVTIVYDLVGSTIATAILAGTFQTFNFGDGAPGGNYNYYGYLDGLTGVALPAYPPRFTAQWRI